MTATVKLLVVLSAVVGLLYPLLRAFMLSPEAMIAAKGAGVGLLALAAVLRARTADGWLLASLLALGAAGDMLLEVRFAAGAAAFAAGHVCAIALYLRNHRTTGQARLAAAALIVSVAAAVPGLLLHGRPEALPFILYGLLLGGMTATAWLSRFPFFVPLGAAMFLASDMLIAARIGMRLTYGWLGLAIWLLYYAGQVMIFAGVTSALPPRERSSGGGEPAKLVEG
ncbi:MAG TPA: lysoplasmalogenase family protein [Allosphingosinicella sp.]